MSTYTPIASQTVGTATNSITFSSLPQNYTDLILVISGGMDTTTGYALSVQVNGDTGSNYSTTYLIGNGSTTYSGVYSTQPAMYLGAPAKNTLDGAYILQFQNYSNSATNKTVLARTNSAALSTWASVSLWRNTAPITSIKIYPETANWLSGTTFTIYGVSAGNSSAKATGGNIVTTDGTYWYHTFTSSGTFTPSQALNVDYLVIAGGGAGGGNAWGRGSGGGGAGGFRTSIGGSQLSLSANTVYPALVGAGGATNNNLSYGSTAYTIITPGGKGGNSLFASISATGGGGGATTTNGITGGSGGGVGELVDATGGAGNEGGYTPVEGYKGGTGSASYGATGGGGAGGAGVDRSSNNSTDGGPGRSSSISGTSVTYAGGGGGGVDFDSGGRSAGAGGTGGGGAGATSGANAGAGTVNTGSGGGGGSGNGGAGYASGAGGSGIIIVRYAV